MESAGARYLRTRFCIRNLTRSLRPLVRFLIRQQLVRKYRTPALSMKYSLCMTMYSHILVCITMNCHVLPCAAMYSHVLVCITMYCHVRPSIAMYYHVLPCIAMYCHE